MRHRIVFQTLFDHLLVFNELVGTGEPPVDLAVKLLLRFLLALAWQRFLQVLGKIFVCFLVQSLVDQRLHPPRGVVLPGLLVVQRVGLRRRFCISARHGGSLLFFLLCFFLLEEHV